MALRRITAAAGVALAMWFTLLVLVYVRSGYVFIGLAVLAVALRVIAPAGMLRVIQAVRSAIRRALLLQQHTTSSWIEIRTTNHRLVVEALKDGLALFDVLTRRCPTARVE